MIKQLSILISIIVLVSSCNSDKKERKPLSVKTSEMTVAQKIAEAHGYKNWKNVEEIQFTFRVDRNGQEGNGRSWTWFPKQDSVVMQTGEQYVKYNRTKLDSSAIDTDRAFINDKFWLLIPFQLVWDEGTTISESKQRTAPISKNKMNYITITYSDQGGYTPGDAYDIYYDEDYIIREWNFRKGNAKEPTMSTTFENYKRYKGLVLAKDHKMGDNDFSLNFSNISVQ